MNPHDPRYPPGPPGSPYQQPPSQGWGPQGGQQPGAPQGQGPYGQQPGGFPQQSPPQAGPYGQPYGQPQYPQGQQPGQPYYPGQAPPAKKGGAGAIIAIIIAAVVVVLGGGGVAAWMLLGEGSGLSEDVDHSAALKVKAQALMTAVQSGDPSQVEGPLLELAVLPEHATAWFTVTFGPELGAKLAKDYEEDVFQKLPEMIRPFKEAIKSGHTVIKVNRVTAPGDPSDKYQQSLLKKMKKPRALYTVEFYDAKDWYGTRIYYFTVVNGHLGYLGSMVGGW
jgi:hypothetical protein